MNEIVNKVAQSGLITLDPVDFFPTATIRSFDLRSVLIDDFLLREKYFREWIGKHDWTPYRGSHVAVYCSNDAIIPVWAWMLLTADLEPYAASIFYGTSEALQEQLFLKNITSMPLEQYRDQRVIIKGCGDQPIPPSIYVEFTRILTPIVKSLMFGEACSTVPVYKKNSPKSNQDPSPSYEFPSRHLKNHR